MRVCAFVHASVCGRTDFGNFKVRPNQKRTDQKYVSAIDPVPKMNCRQVHRRRVSVGAAEVCVAAWRRKTPLVQHLLVRRRNRRTKTPIGGYPPAGAGVMPVAATNQSSAVVAAHGLRPIPTPTRCSPAPPPTLTRQTGRRPQAGRPSGQRSRAIAGRRSPTQGRYWQAARRSKRRGRRPTQTCPMMRAKSGPPPRPAMIRVLG